MAGGGWQHLASSAKELASAGATKTRAVTSSLGKAVVRHKLCGGPAGLAHLLGMVTAGRSAGWLWEVHVERRPALQRLNRTVPHAPWSSGGHQPGGTAPGGGRGRRRTWQQPAAAWR